MAYLFNYPFFLRFITKVTPQILTQSLFINRQGEKPKCFRLFERNIPKSLLLSPTFKCIFMPAIISRTLTILAQIYY
jgi:hypothetical protein